jgi:hypothetical protein
MRWAACAVLLGGCLIVHTNEVPIDDPCPTIRPELLADASGPIALGDAIYYVGANGTLTRMSYDGGVPSELTPAPVRARRLAVDGGFLYWTTDSELVRKPLAGGAPTVLASGYAGMTELAVDDAGVVFADSTGLHRWAKAGDAVEMLDRADLILGLGAHAGTYYYSVTFGEVVRRAPPTQDLASAHYPGPLVVDAGGVYFFEAADPFVENAGTIRLVPRDGGEVVTTAADLAPVSALAADDSHLYFVSQYSRLYRIQRVSRFGGAVRTVACGPYEQQEVFVAVDSLYIYFTDGHGLYRLAKQVLPG